MKFAMRSTKTAETAMPTPIAMHDLIIRLRSSSRWSRNPIAPLSSSSLSFLGALFPAARHAVIGRILLASGRCADVLLHDFEHEVLTGFRRSRVVRFAVRDVIRQDAQAQKRHLKRSCDLGGGRCFHLLDRRAELVVQPLDAIEFAVPGVARADHALNHAALSIPIAQIKCRGNKTRVSAESADDAC